MRNSRQIRQIRQTYPLCFAPLITEDHRARAEINTLLASRGIGYFRRSRERRFLPPPSPVSDSIGSRKDSRDFRVRRLRPCHDDDGGGSSGGCTGLILAPRGNAIIEWFASRSARLRLPLSVEHASEKKPRVVSGRSRGRRGTGSRDRPGEAKVRYRAPGGHWLNRELAPAYRNNAAKLRDARCAISR